jgi:hypothetical protein
MDAPIDTRVPSLDVVHGVVLAPLAIDHVRVS